MNVKSKAIHWGVASVLTLLSGGVNAHTLTGSIPASKTAVVKWQTTCGPNTAQMVFRLQQAAKQNFSVSLKVSSGEVSETVTTLGMKKIWTPNASVVAGAGVYLLTLSKIGTNPNKAISYTVEEHCHNAAGQEVAQTKPVRVR